MDVELVITERHRRLGMAAVATACFAVLAVLIRQHAPALASLDARWHAASRLYGLDHPAWLTVMRALTHLGDTATVAVIDVIAIVVCLALGRRKIALFAAATALLTWSVRLGLRDLIGRPRPDDAFWTADGLSFPSGHTANSAAMAIIVSVAVWPYLGSVARSWVATVAVAVPLTVGLTRVAGGVHWPSDVLGGLLLAVAVAAVCAAAILPRDAAD